MPFLAQCPFCDHRAQCPDSAYLGSGRCPKCSSYYTLVPAEEPSRTMATIPRRVPEPAAVLPRPSSSPVLPAATLPSPGVRPSPAVAPPRAREEADDVSDDGDEER